MKADIKKLLASLNWIFLMAIILCCFFFMVLFYLVAPILILVKPEFIKNLFNLTDSSIRWNQMLSILWIIAFPLFSSAYIFDKKLRRKTIARLKNIKYLIG